MEKNSLLTGSITKKLISFTIPIVLALLLQAMYSSIDMLIVGNYGTVADVSGVSTGSQIMMTITSLCTGLAMGTTILISQKVGQGKNEKIGDIIFNSSVIFITLSVAITILLLIFPEAVMGLMNVPQEAINETKDYLFYCTLGIPVIFAYNVLGSIFRGLGDSKTPLIAVAIAAVINIVLDLILVAGFDMGAAGAAIATVFAQIVSLILSLVIVIRRKDSRFEIGKGNFKVNNNIIKTVINIGLPIAIQSILVNISFLFITIMINQFGVIFSASVGLVEKIIGIVMLVPIAFMQSMAVFVGQNYSANKNDRAKKGLLIGIIISMIFSLIMAYISWFHGEILISIFSSDSEVILVANTYLKAYSIDTLLVPIMFCLSGYFNGKGRTTFVMIQAVTGAVLIRIPLTYILSEIEPVSLFRVGLATPAATAIQIIMCVTYYIYIDRKELKERKSM